MKSTPINLPPRGMVRILTTEAWRPAPPPQAPQMPDWMYQRFDLVLRAVGCSFEAFASKRRTKSLVRHRRVVWWVMRNWPTRHGDVMSYPELAYTSGKLNHSTVLTALRDMTDEERAEAQRILDEVKGKRPGIGSLLVEAACGRV